MSFWTVEGKEGLTPKFKDRFVVIIGGNIRLNAKSVTKPVLTFENKEYKMMNHHFKFPGLPKWNSIKIVFVDLDGEGTIKEANKDDWSAATFLRALVQDGGYLGHDNISTPSKASMIDSLGDIKIQQISHSKLDNNDKMSKEGKIRVVEQWTLVNPIIKSVDWGQLSYADDGLVEYSLELEYDYAIMNNDNQGIGG